MDGKRLKVESKCETRCNVDGVDRISQLSDDIIVDILSNLRLRDAASTSVLSTRWYDLWRYIPILDVTQHIWKIKKLKECMHSIVKKHKAKSLKKFSLSLDLGSSSSSLCLIATWLEFAFSKRVEAMHLGGGIPYKSRYDDLDDGLDELLKFRPGNLLKSSTLTSLHLQRFNVSGEVIKLILRDCHLLERLVIDTSIFTSDIDISGGATGLRLKHLDIRCRGGYQMMIKVAAPNLTYLGINCTEMKIFVENVPKLVEVALVSGDLSILQKHNIISQLQILTLYNFHRPLVRPTKTIPTMPKLLELDVTYFRCSKFLPTVTSLVRASPLLQTFNLKQFPGQNKESETDMEVANVEAFEHRNLKVFRFREFDIDVAHHMELVSCILDNCVALRKLIIITKKHWLPLIISQETFIEKAKQLIQPKLPTNVELQVISSISSIS